MRGCIQVIVKDGEDRVEEDADSWRLLREDVFR
jgi:hypothetical protein